MAARTFRTTSFSWPTLAALAALQAASLACVTRYVTPVASRPMPPAPASAAAPVAQWGPEEEPFYGDLQPYGEWVYVQGPGWVWSPYNVAADWRPYTVGHWVLTDDGWTWASDEEFGWATYHYGRWQVDARYGWVWAPGTEWAPAWVAWHEGSGWVGWAPLPWQVSWRAGVGFDWGGLDVNIALGPSTWCFVEARHMVTPAVGVYVAPVTRNVTLIQNTVNVTNYVSVDNRVVNQSVRPDKIGRALGHAVPRYRLEPVAEPVAARGGRIDGDRLVVYKPDPRRGGSSQRRDLPPGHDGWNGREGGGPPVEDEPALAHGPHSHPSRPQEWPQPANANPHGRPPLNSRPQAAPPANPAPANRPGTPAPPVGGSGRPHGPQSAPSSSQGTAHVPQGQVKNGGSQPAPSSSAPASSAPPQQGKQGKPYHAKPHPNDNKDCSNPKSEGCGSH
jgi:hypothetical protein